MKMPNLGGLLSRANAIPGVFWYKMGLVIVLFVAYTGGVASWATHRCEIKHEQQKTEQAEEKTRVIVKEVQVRIPVVQKVEVASAKQKAEIANLKVRLDEALKRRPENPTCDLSDDELAGVQGLAAKTHIK